MHMWRWVCGIPRIIAKVNETCRYMGNAIYGCLVNITLILFLFFSALVLSL